MDAVDEKLTTSVVVSDIGSVSVRDYQKEGTKAAVSYTAYSSTAYLELPIQSYLGYRAVDELGNSVEIGRGDGGRMRFSLKGDGAEHRIYVRYGPVPRFVAADVVSALTILYCLFRCLKSTFKEVPGLRQKNADNMELSEQDRFDMEDQDET